MREWLLKCMLPGVVVLVLSGLALPLMADDKQDDSGSTANPEKPSRVVGRNRLKDFIARAQSSAAAIKLANKPARAVASDEPGKKPEHSDKKENSKPAATDPDDFSHGTFEVRELKNISYYSGEGYVKDKHKLDLYLPEGKTDFPMVMFVHGGAWVFGDRDFFGVHAAVGKMFARHGVGCVVTSYRLSPAVKHPEHIRDVARAFAWTQKNAAKYGGRPEQIFLCGHSAGGHLSSLLATDEGYLKAEGLSIADISGVMAISGVYHIPPGMFKEVFGNDKEERKNASPITHVRADCPPFLIIYGDHDFPFCDKMSEEFGRALKSKKATAEVLKIDDRNHISILTDIVEDDDPCTKALVEFVARRVKAAKEKEAPRRS